MNALVKLISLLQDPANKILVIMDTSGSVRDETIEDFLCTVDDAQSLLDPQGQRLFSVTDRALLELTAEEKSDPARIEVGTRHVHEIAHQLSRGGGTSQNLSKFLEKDFFKQFAPTHLVLMGDTYGAFELSQSEDLNSLAKKINLCFLATPDDAPVLKDACEKMVGLCSVNEIVGHSKRKECLAQYDYDTISEGVPTPSASARPGPRI